jgi:alpha-glucosidase (family GH31 glycosyl hydrolase)
MIERPLVDFKPLETKETSCFTLTNPDGFSYELVVLQNNLIKLTLQGPNRPLPPHGNVIWKGEPLAFDSREDDVYNLTTTLTVGDTTITVAYEDTVVVEVFRDGERLYADTPHKSYCLNEHGIARYTRFDSSRLHVGMGEKAAPLDLSRRSFTISGSDAANYDPYLTDPLYKHTPFLISAPKNKGLSVALYSASNSDATWDIGRFVDEPWTMFKKHSQDWGGLEEYIIIGETIQSLVTLFGKLVGMPQLVPRDWLGYLASGMGLGESDDPPAQELLEKWPQLCQQHKIPCSAMHLSSGYTVDDNGERCVFTMNKKRYPDFAAMVRVLQKHNIKVAPNVKPYVLESHPDYERLYRAGALFKDPKTNKPVVTRIWSSQPGINANGSWVDLTSRAGQDWWKNGILGLADLGVDAIWNDNNEYLLFDDEFLCDNNSDGKEPLPIGLIGRMTHTEWMARKSQEALLERRPAQRAFVLTRSANVGTMRYATSTWSGDNWTSWRSLRGSVAMNLNAQMSLMQSYGNDIGGFGGPLPSPELFVRWVQMGVTIPRFCIHSFKPCKEDPTGSTLNNMPWMYPHVADVIRKQIEWRYEMIPYLNNLNWRSHLYAEPANTWLGWNEFASDSKLYEDEIIEGLDYWFGHGQLLVAGAYFANQFSRKVYLPSSSSESTKDQKVYYDLNEPYAMYSAGSTVDISTPLDHFAMFAREGTVIPVGKPQVTLTQREGNSHVLTEDRGGVVGYDDLRVLQLFPAPPSRGSVSYEYRWIEDEGELLEPVRADFVVKFESDADEVRVEVRKEEGNFTPLWMPHVSIVLPVGDRRQVANAINEGSWKGRKTFVVAVHQH